MFFYILLHHQMRHIIPCLITNVRPESSCQPYIWAIALRDADPSPEVAQPAADTNDQLWLPVLV